MPFLFLSPSTQDYNPYATTGNEQYWMNQIADRIEPILHASGYNVTRNDSNGSAAKSIRDSNAGSYDFHLALHSNASPAATAGENRGVDIYYFPNSEDAQRMANIIVDNLRPIYPEPDKVQAVTSTIIGEVRRTKAPAVLCELGYHDNLDDEAWILDNLDEIAKALALSVTEYFGTPFFLPGNEKSAVVTLSSGVLNLRSLPNTVSDILAQIPNGSVITVFGEEEGWCAAMWEGIYGYVKAAYLQQSR